MQPHQTCRRRWRGPTSPRPSLRVRRWCVRSTRRQLRPQLSRPIVESRGDDNEILPTRSDLVASGTALPELHLDIHVHSNNAAERFVFVNMRKYVEGQSLSEGPTVERITGEGVVLNQRGLRFLLPRQ